MSVFSSSHAHLSKSSSWDHLNIGASSRTRPKPSKSLDPEGQESLLISNVGCSFVSSLVDQAALPFGHGPFPPLQLDAGFVLPNLSFNTQILAQSHPGLCCLRQVT